MCGETILVVDDNRQVLDVLADNLLPRLGYKTLVAYNGQTALSIAKTDEPDLMLLDFQLSDINGLDVLRRLAQEGSSLPTILITGEGSEQVAVEAFRLGVQDYLIKPLDVANLKAAISRSLAETRLRREKAALTAKLRQQVAWLMVLSKVGRSVTSTLELDEVLRRIVEAGVHITKAEEGFLALLDESKQQLWLRAVKNIDQIKSKTLRLRVDDTLAGRVIQTGRPVRKTKGEKKQPLKVSTGYLAYSLLHVPIFSKGKVLGVLSVNNQTKKRAFTHMDETLLLSLADYAAVAIENARLYERSQHEVAERKQAEQATKTSLVEKELLLKEIHHRVKNNLQIISSLLNLQSTHTDDPRLQEICQDSQDRIRSMALIHEKLYRSENLALIKLAEYLEELTDYLFRSHSVAAHKIELKIEANEVLLDINTAIPCGLIINELVSNAFKHAFVNGQQGKIVIKIWSNTADQLTILVNDNGIGLPGDIDFRNATSLGLQLVNALVTQLDGTIELERQHGTTFKVTLRIG